MLQRVPDYFDAFHCLAGHCPRSCCIGWEVEIDDDTAAAYAAVSGPLGNELRCQLQQDEDGALCFPLSGRRCPFLDGENLCRIHRELGQEYTSITCREHPRFTEDFGPLREISLSASCPEAARLLCTGTAPLTFRETLLPDEDEPGDDWLEPLLAVRDTAMAILAVQTVPARRRMAQVLTLAVAAQALLDDDRAEELPALCRMPTNLPAAPEAAAPLFPAALEMLSSLEILDGDWSPLLTAAREGGTPLPDILLERLTEYFLFRWLLKAVNDGDLLGRVQLALFSVLTMERLASHTESVWDALCRFCREIEHCEENMDALREAFLWDEAFSADIFFRELLA